jgi:hypothetical protein
MPPPGISPNTEYGLSTWPNDILWSLNKIDMIYVQSLWMAEWESQGHFLTYSLSVPQRVTYSLTLWVYPRVTYSLTLWVYPRVTYSLTLWVYPRVTYSLTLWVYRRVTYSLTLWVNARVTYPLSVPKLAWWCPYLLTSEPKNAKPRKTS